MNLKGKTFTVVQMVALICYYGFTRWLPNNDTLIIGKFCGKLRAFNCRFIFKKNGKRCSCVEKSILCSRNEY